MDKRVPDIIALVFLAVIVIQHQLLYWGVINAVDLYRLDHPEFMPWRRNQWFDWLALGVLVGYVGWRVIA